MSKAGLAITSVNWVIEAARNSVFPKRLVDEDVEPAAVCERGKDMQMRAVVAEKFGEYKNLKLVDIPKPEVSERRVRS